MKATTAAAALVLAAVTGCGNGTSASVTADRTTEPTSPSPSPTPTCSTHSGFELSLVSDRGGQDGTDATGTFTRSGQFRLHTVQGPDKTWQVDSGTLACK